MATLEVLVGESERGGGAEEGTSFAALTLFVKILQQCVYQQESDSEGTGTLESDLALLAAEREREGAGGATMTPFERNCVIYRMGQKRIAREYLRLAQQRLKATYPYTQQQ